MRRLLYYVTKCSDFPPKLLWGEKNPVAVCSRISNTQNLQIVARNGSLFCLSERKKVCLTWTKMPSHDHCCAPQWANVRDPFDKTLKFPWISQLTQTFAVSGLQGSTETICVWETWHQILSEHFCEGCKTVEHPVPIYFAHKTYRYPVGRKRPRPRSDSPCDRPASEGIVVADAYSTPRCLSERTAVSVWMRERQALMTVVRQV